MAVNINVDINELDKQVVRMNKLLENYRNDINLIYKACLYQINIEWKSDENKEFIVKFEQHLKEMEVMANSIEKYISILQIASQEYKEAIESASQITLR